MAFLTNTYSFVDIETTGSMYSTDKIIEIAIIKVRNGEIIDEYQTLVNPAQPFNPFITQITGIQEYQLETAPLFSTVQNSVANILKDSIFVAHNVSFDYGFIEREFHQLQIPFAQEMLCTVKLSRFLYPEHKRHNLDSVASRLKVTIQNRHRAYDDARVLYDFYKHISQEFPEQALDFALQKLLSQPKGQATFGNLPL